MTQGSRRLVIHAGQMKTGSTSIQHALANRAIEVEGESWDFPLIPLSLTENHHDLRAVIERAYGEGGLFARAKLAALGAWLATKRADTVILSAEVFNGLDPKDLARAAKIWGARFDRVEVVMYTRPHLGAMTSIFIEFIKGGQALGDMDQYLNRLSNRFFLADKFNAWRDVFGDAFTLRPFLRDELRGGSVVSDFAQTLFPDASISVQSAPTMNVSLGIRDLMRLKVWHRTLADRGWKKRYQLGWPLGDLMMRGAPRDVPRLKIHRSLADTLAGKFAKDARALDRDFFGGRPLFQDALERERLAAEEKPMSVRPEDWLMADEVAALEAMATIFVQSQGRNPLWRLHLHRHYLRRQREDS